MVGTHGFVLCFIKFCFENFYPFRQVLLFVCIVFGHSSKPFISNFSGDIVLIHSIEKVIKLFITNNVILTLKIFIFITVGIATVDNFKALFGLLKLVDYEKLPSKKNKRSCKFMLFDCPQTIDFTVFPKKFYKNTPTILKQQFKIIRTP